MNFVLRVCAFCLSFKNVIWVLFHDPFGYNCENFSSFTIPFIRRKITLKEKTTCMVFFVIHLNKVIIICLFDVKYKYCIALNILKI